MIEIEAQAPPEVAARIGPVLEFACAQLDIERASLGLMVVEPAQMAEINGAYRAAPVATDVLAFPVDGPEVAGGWPATGPAPELGDIVLCPEAATEPLETLAVHGLLHLLGYDHETDAGEMLRLQDDLIGRYGLGGTG